MFRIAQLRSVMQKRTFKNFGHKRTPDSTFTVLWQGFLTFSFIGMGIEWKRISKYFFGDEIESDSILEANHADD